MGQQSIDHINSFLHIFRLGDLAALLSAISDCSIYNRTLLRIHPQRYLRWVKHVPYLFRIHFILLSCLQGSFLAYLMWLILKALLFLGVLETYFYWEHILGPTPVNSSNFINFLHNDREQYYKKTDEARLSKKISDYRGLCVFRTSFWTFFRIFSKIV